MNDEFYWTDSNGEIKWATITSSTLDDFMWILPDGYIKNDRQIVEKVDHLKDMKELFEI